jgi:hypothetical protein
MTEKNKTLPFFDLMCPDEQLEACLEYLRRVMNEIEFVDADTVDADHRLAEAASDIEDVIRTLQWWYHF